MKKTLYAYMDNGEQKRITAEKVDHIVDGQMNVYEDKDGNQYIVRKNKFRGMVFIQVHFNNESKTY